MNSELRIATSEFRTPNSEFRPQPSIWTRVDKKAHLFGKCGNLLRNTGMRTGGWDAEAMLEESHFLKR